MKEKLRNDLEVPSAAQKSIANKIESIVCLLIGALKLWKNVFRAILNILSFDAEYLFIDFCISDECFFHVFAKILESSVKSDVNSTLLAILCLRLILCD